MSRKVYDQSWHDTYSVQTLTSAQRILPTVLQISPIESICEFGCGHGHWLAAAIDSGIKDVVGLDGAWTDTTKLLFPKELFRAVDLGKPIPLERQFDLAISLEVGEHIAAESAATFVGNITSASPMVLFGAAIPLQGGYNHINEQYPSYWRALFDRRGYDAFDIVRPTHWNDTEIHYYYRQNALLYVKRESSHLIERCREFQHQANLNVAPLDFVHPEKYDLMASYNAIALKRLIPKLPKSILGYLTRKL